MHSAALLRTVLPFDLGSGSGVGTDVKTNDRGIGGRRVGETGEM